MRFFKSSILLGILLSVLAIGSQIGVAKAYSWLIDLRKDGLSSGAILAYAEANYEGGNTMNVAFSPADPTNCLLYTQASYLDTFTNVWHHFAHYDLPCVPGDTLPVDVTGVTQMVLWAYADVSWTEQIELPADFGDYATLQVSDSNTAYFDASLTGVDSSYLGTYDAFCIDLGSPISPVEYYPSYVYYSPDTFSPDIDLTAEEYQMLNYMINRYYSYWQGQGCTISDIQDAIWLISDPQLLTVNDVSAKTLEIYNDALANGVGYAPGCGEYVGVVVEPDPAIDDAQHQIVMYPVICDQGTVLWEHKVVEAAYGFQTGIDLSNLPTETPTDTATSTVTNTPVPSDTATATATDTPTATDTATSTNTPVPSDTPTATATDTPTATNTPVPTDTPTLPPLACQTQNPDRLDCSSLNVRGTCSGGSAVFTIRNGGEAGDGDMRAPTEWRLIDANGNIIDSGTVLLGGGESMTVTYDGGGEVTLEADQQVGHPGNSLPQDTLTCG